MKRKKDSPFFLSLTRKKDEKNYDLPFRKLVKLLEEERRKKEAADTNVQTHT